MSDRDKTGYTFVRCVTCGEIACSCPTAPRVEGWQPIETAPKDGTPILSHKAGVWAMPMIVCWLDGPGIGEPAWRQYDAEPSIVRRHPTHWMPLPTPPRETGGR